MATSVGQINFGVGVDASRISAELTAALTPALTQVQRRLDRNPLRVSITIDTRAAIEAARRDLARANLSVSASLNIDTRTAIRAAQRELDRLSSRTVRLNFTTNLSTDQVALMRQAASAMRRLESRDVDLGFFTNLDADTVQSLRQAASAIRRLEDRAVTVRITLDVDEERLRRVSDLIRGIRDQRATININTNEIERANQRASGLTRSLGMIGRTAGGIAAVGGALAAITGAAGLAAGAIGGLLIGVMSLGPAIGGIIGTIAVGVQGIGDAFTAMGNVTANAASEARTQSEAVASAQNSLASASDAAVSAQEGLARANEDAARAAEEVGEAYQQAERDLRNYQLTAQEAALDEREAAFALEDAQKAVLEARNPDEHERAILRVQQAELRLVRAQDRAREAAEENAEAQEKGIENSDAVTTARERQAQADQAVTAAERQVAAAARQVAQATQALTQAQTQATPSVEKFNQALAELSPNARAFVLAAQAAAPAWDSFTEGVQDSLFANLNTELTETANVTLPAVQEGMNGVAGALNSAAVQAANFIQSERGIALINNSLAASEGLLRGLTGGTGALTQGWLDFTTTVAPRMEEVGAAIASIGESVGAVFSGLANSGQLDAIMTGFADTLRGLGPLLASLLSAFGTMATEVLPALRPLFESLGQALVTIAPALGQIGAVFAQTLTAIMPALSEFIAMFAEALVPILPVLKVLLESLGDALGPILPILGQIVITIGQALIGAVNALAPALGPFLEAFNALLEAVAPVVPLVATIVAELVQALAPALTVIFQAFQPFISQLADALIPVIQQMAPILAEVALIIGQALADALLAIAPVLPQLIGVFGQLITAVLPLLPVIAQLAADLLPSLTQIILAIVPVITQLAQVIIWLADFAINTVLVPVLEWLAPFVTGIFNTIADVVTWVFEDVIGGAIDWLTETAFPALGTALDSVKGWFSGAVEFIGNAWAGLMDKAAVPINFVIETVWNNGLLKAWRSIDDLLGGVLPDGGELTPIARRATGGPLSYLHGGSGNGTKDDMLFWGSNNEHVVTSQEVIRAGGHNILFAIRDMILRGIPFTWDNGRIISELGRKNLDRYGAAVAQQGYGNVPPEGLFDPLARVPIPQFAEGGPIFPWMHQLKAGHDFARAQNGKPYQWAGPTGPGSSFDCSGFMGSIIAAILGDDPWRRYWATSSFAGYPSVGPQGLTKNLFEGSGMAVGITDDPGGPGGGHTAGELRGIPELGIPAARVESGGALGDVHYGRGTDPNSFASLYGLPIGANGFFQPAPGGGQNGPSTGQQESFLRGTIERIVNTVTDPVRDLIQSVIGNPPPSIRGVPVGVLDLARNGVIDFADKAVGGLGGLLGGAWQKAQDIGEGILDFVNPFDNGGIANGTGFMPKNVIAPERVLSPEQTELFEALVAALQSISNSGAQAIGGVVVDLSTASIEALRGVSGTVSGEELFVQSIEDMERSQSSIAAEQAIEAQQQRDLLLSVAARLGGDVLGPIMESAVNAGVDFLNSLIAGLGDEVVAAVNGTTQAVNNLDSNVTGGTTGTAPAPFGAPGSSFDAVSAISNAVVQVADTARQAFEQVGQDIANAAFAQTPSRVSESRGRLGEDISGGFLIDLIVRLTGVEIEILDTLENTLEEITAFREDSFNAFEASGELVSDTASLVQRNQSSIELQAKESERIQKALIKAVLKYLIVNVLLPIITAILGAMITLATTAIGAAIGSVIPVIGPLIGAAVGAAIGAGLAGLATVFGSLLAVGAGAALDAFDEGGVAYGTGYMPKNTIAPERVLSPRQTAAFESLVPVLDRMSSGNRTVQIGSVNVHGRDPAQRTADNLLQLLNS